MAGGPGEPQFPAIPRLGLKEDRTPPGLLFAWPQHSKASAASADGCLLCFFLFISFLLKSSLQAQQMTGLHWTKPGSGNLRTAPDRLLHRKQKLY